MSEATHIEVSIARQELTLHGQDGSTHVYPVSTARNGPGERSNSECTPRGRHRVRLVIGRDCPENAVFVGRRFTGEIYSPALAAAEPGRDWILTHIIWLTGEESGFNRGGACDTLRRFIYLHGTPDTEPMGIPRSHGCIRMRNSDIMELAEFISPGTLVVIRQ
mgnify:CR=1 FL=1